jgi:hypothetical protein
VVTVCDHLDLLGGIELKHEVRREALRIALDGLVQRLGRHAIELGQIGVNHHLEPAQHLNAPLDARQQRACRCCGRSHAFPDLRQLVLLTMSQSDFAFACCSKTAVTPEMPSYA